MSTKGEKLQASEGPPGAAWRNLRDNRDKQDNRDNRVPAGPGHPSVPGPPVPCARGTATPPGDPAPVQHSPGGLGLLHYLVPSLCPSRAAAETPGTPPAGSPRSPPAQGARRARRRWRRGPPSFTHGPSSAPALFLHSTSSTPALFLPVSAPLLPVARGLSPESPRAAMALCGRGWARCARGLRLGSLLQPGPCGTRGVRGSNPFTRQQEEEWRRRNRSAVGYIAAAAVGMVGLSYAAVPLYRLYCQVRGARGRRRGRGCGALTALP